MIDLAARCFRRSSPECSVKGRKRERSISLLGHAGSPLRQAEIVPKLFHVPGVPLAVHTHPITPPALGV